MRYMYTRLLRWRDSNMAAKPWDHCSRRPVDICEFENRWIFFRRHQDMFLAITRQQNRMIFGWNHFQQCLWRQRQVGELWAVPNPYQTDFLCQCLTRPVTRRCRGTLIAQVVERSPVRRRRNPKRRLRFSFNLWSFSACQPISCHLSICSISIKAKRKQKSIKKYSQVCNIRKSEVSTYLWFAEKCIVNICLK